MGLGRPPHRRGHGDASRPRRVAVTVSQTTGTVRVFRDGEIVLELRQTAAPDLTAGEPRPRPGRAPGAALAATSGRVLHAPPGRRRLRRCRRRRPTTGSTRGTSTSPTSTTRRSAAWTIRLHHRAAGESERVVRLAPPRCTSALFCALLLPRRAPAVRLPAPRWPRSRAACVTPLFSAGADDHHARRRRSWPAGRRPSTSPCAPSTRSAAAWLARRRRGGRRGRAGQVHRAGCSLPQILLALLLDPRGRRLLRTPWPWVGARARPGRLLPGGDLERPPRLGQLRLPARRAGGGRPRLLGRCWCGASSGCRR